MVKNGDKVKILRKDIYHLKHRKNRNGTVTNVNGYLILVRPMWCNWEVELYPNEVELIER
jgi:hypothetical protein